MIRNGDSTAGGRRSQFWRSWSVDVLIDAEPVAIRISPLHEVSALSLFNQLILYSFYLEDVAYGGGEDAAGVVLHKLAFGFDGQTHVGRYEPFHAGAGIQAQACLLYTI